MINLNIDERGLEQVILDLAATEKQVKAALSRTVVKMAGWMRARTVPGLSQELQIQQKEVRRRLKTFRVQRRGDQISITVWYGLDPISMIHLQAKQDGIGVSASGGRHVPGAFIRTVGQKELSTGETKDIRKVFKRQGPERIIKKGRYQGQMRQPLATQLVPIQPAAEGYLSGAVSGSEFQRRFFDVFSRELAWATRTEA